jgi:hypothetical protein
MKTRKATDVIIDLETKVDSLVGYIKNMDNNIKLLLGHINELKMVGVNPPVVAPNSSPPAVAKQAMKFEEMPKTNIFDGLKEQAGIQDNSTNNSIEEQPDDELIEEVVHTGERRGSRVATQSSNKISVSQQIFMPDGSPMFLASVEIMDFNGMLVKQTRTNTKGRWIAPLEQGNYSVHVVKRTSDNSKEPIELQFVVEIPSSEAPLELDPPDLEETMV